MAWPPFAAIKRPVFAHDQTEAADLPCRCPPMHTAV